MSTYAETDPYTQPSVTDPFPGEELDLGTYNPNAAERIFRHDLEPGTRYTFRFKLAENEPFTVRQFTVDGETKKTLQINFEAATDITLHNGQQAERTVKFQRADFYKSAKMAAAGMASSAERLLSALGYEAAGQLNVADVKAFLTQAGAQQIPFKATVKWRAYEKGEDGNVTAYSTHPRKNENAWPKATDGKYQDYVVLPSGEKSRGNVELQSFVK